MSYPVARLKLAYGRAMAAIADVAFQQRDHGLKLVRIGTHYGGWYCVPALLAPGRVAMCCGAGEDISFDVALNATWGMRIICVDPTPRSIGHVAALLGASREGSPMLIEAGPLKYEISGFRPESFSFVARAVWSADGMLDLFAPQDPAHVSYSALNLQHTSARIQVQARTVGTLLRECNVERLDLLKLDIEGAEHEVLRSMLGAGIRPAQLLVEFDQVNQPLTVFFWVELLRMLGQLKLAGYRLVHRERANFVFVLRGAVER